MIDLQKSTAKQRGRPKNTGIDDSHTMQAIANIRLENPGFSLRKAIKAATDQPEYAPRPCSTPESNIRRLTAKWRIEGESYLNIAREQRLTEQIEKLKQTVVRSVEAWRLINQGFYQHAQVLIPVLQNISDKFSTYLSTPEGQASLTFMRKVQAMQRDPRIAAWNFSALPKS